MTSTRFANDNVFSLPDNAERTTDVKRKSTCPHKISSTKVLPTVKQCSVSLHNFIDVDILDALKHEIRNAKQSESEQKGLSQIEMYPTDILTNVPGNRTNRTARKRKPNSFLTSDFLFSPEELQKAFTGKRRKRDGLYCMIDHNLIMAVVKKNKNVFDFEEKEAICNASWVNRLPPVLKLNLADNNVIVHWKENVDHLSRKPQTAKTKRKLNPQGQKGKENEVSGVKRVKIVREKTEKQVSGMVQETSLPRQELYESEQIGNEFDLKRRDNDEMVATSSTLHQGPVIGLVSSTKSDIQITPQSASEILYDLSKGAQHKSAGQLSRVDVTLKQPHFSVSMAETALKLNQQKRLYAKNVETTEMALSVPAGHPISSMPDSTFVPLHNLSENAKNVDVEKLPKQLKVSNQPMKDGLKEIVRKLETDVKSTNVPVNQSIEDRVKDIVSQFQADATAKMKKFNKLLMNTRPNIASEKKNFQVLNNNVLCDQNFTFGKTKRSPENNVCLEKRNQDFLTEVITRQLKSNNVQSNDQTLSTPTSDKQKSNVHTEVGNRNTPQTTNVTKTFKSTIDELARKEKTTKFMQLIIGDKVIFIPRTDSTLTGKAYVFNKSEVFYSSMSGRKQSDSVPRPLTMDGSAILIDLSEQNNEFTSVMSMSASETVGGTATLNKASNLDIEIKKEPNHSSLGTETVSSCSKPNCAAADNTKSKGNISEVNSFITTGCIQKGESVIKNILTKTTCMTASTNDHVGNIQKEVSGSKHPLTENRTASRNTVIGNIQKEVSCIKHPLTQNMTASRNTVIGNIQKDQILTKLGNIQKDQVPTKLQTTTVSNNNQGTNSQTLQYVKENMVVNTAPLISDIPNIQPTCIPQAQQISELLNTTPLYYSVVTGEVFGQVLIPCLYPTYVPMVTPAVQVLHAPLNQLIKYPNVVESTVVQTAFPNPEVSSAQQSNFSLQNLPLTISPNVGDLYSSQSSLPLPAANCFPQTLVSDPLNDYPSQSNCTKVAPVIESPLKTVVGNPLSVGALSNKTNLPPTVVSMAYSSQSKPLQSPFAASQKVFSKPDSKSQIDLPSHQTVVSNSLTTSSTFPKTIPSFHTIVSTPGSQVSKLPLSIVSSVCYSPEVISLQTGVDASQTKTQFPTTFSNAESIPQTAPLFSRPFVNGRGVSTLPHSEYSFQKAGTVSPPGATSQSLCKSLRIDLPPEENSLANILMSVICGRTTTSTVPTNPNTVARTESTSGNGPLTKTVGKMSGNESALEGGLSFSSIPCTKDASFASVSIMRNTTQMPSEKSSSLAGNTPPVSENKLKRNSTISSENSYRSDCRNKQPVYVGSSLNISGCGNFELQNTTRSSGIAYPTGIVANTSVMSNNVIQKQQTHCSSFPQYSLRPARSLLTNIIYPTGLNVVGTNRGVESLISPKGHKSIPDQTSNDGHQTATVFKREVSDDGSETESETETKGVPVPLDDPESIEEGIKTEKDDRNVQYNTLECPKQDVCRTECQSGADVRHVKVDRRTVYLKSLIPEVEYHVPANESKADEKIRKLKDKLRQQQLQLENLRKTVKH